MSPKKRTKQVNWPKYVTVSNGRVVYRPRISREFQNSIPADKYGYLKPPIKLGKVGDSDDQIIRAYVAAKHSIEHAKEPERNTLSWLSANYQKSRRFCKLNPVTQKKYGQLLELILSHPLKVKGHEAKLGDLLAGQLTKPKLRQILDNRLKRYQEEGKKGTVQVNRQFASLSAMFTWALQYVEGLGITENPCFGIERFTEKAKDRYVTDKEYEIQYKVAAEVAEYLPVFFEHAYLLASRGVEVRTLKISDVTDTGYMVHRRKGSKDNIIEWSDRLQVAYQAALLLHQKRKVSSLYLIVSSTGRNITQNTLQAAMQRLKKKMGERGFAHVYWTAHDLKRKGISDSKDKGIGGHKSERMKAQYNTKLEKYAPPK